MLDNQNKAFVAQEWADAAGQWFQAANQAGACAQDIDIAYTRPSTVHRPRLFIDGDAWCALYGENLQDGVCGFGVSPEEACRAFDVAWMTPLAKKPRECVCTFDDHDDRTVNEDNTCNDGAVRS